MKIGLYTFCVLGLAYACSPIDDERNASIFIVKYPAGGGKTPDSQKLGSILINPGGPGGSGVHFVTTNSSSFGGQTAAESFDKMFNGTYDIVSFDPRGVGLTVSLAECFDNKGLGDLLATIQSNDYGVARDHGKEAADFEYGNLLAGYKLQGELCAFNPERKDLLRFMSTSIVARDMRILHQALGDEQLNYWGFSYGSVIGAVYADMFPQEARRVVIDGVVDSPNYLSGEATNGMADSDATFDHFLSECVLAGPSGCPLAALASSTDELRTKFFDFADNLKVNPMPAVNVTLPQLLTHGMLMQNLFSSLYSPSGWPRMSSLIAAAMQGNANPFVKLYGANLNLPSGPQYNQAFAAIACGDALIDPPSQPWTWKDIANHQAKIDKFSKYFGPLLINNGAQCLSAWPVRSAERHNGNFDSHTNFTLLAIGNDFDPITPGPYADLMAKRFPNAVSVRRAGYGHASISQPSKCMMQIISDYFVNAKVPTQGTYCQVDQPTFPVKNNNKAVTAEQGYVRDVGVIADALHSVHLQTGF